MMGHLKKYHLILRLNRSRKLLISKRLQLHSARILKIVMPAYPLGRKRTAEIQIAIPGTGYPLM
ncbi:hypothetical protein A1353_24555 [Methylomonas methanica]|uniref:Uncharacterized protein n=1 Tax=Methylomonas methanica TaxID=421 RepID=A0A177MU64_METMH|nr:hypothetical protein A1353_24555 [Methylomonas methanica]